MAQSDEGRAPQTATQPVGEAIVAVVPGHHLRAPENGLRFRQGLAVPAPKSTASYDFAAWIVQRSDPPSHQYRCAGATWIVLCVV